MGVRRFELILDNNVYYADQTITGRLLVDVGKPITIRGIRMKYIGKAIVQWTEGSGSNSRTYKNKETYLNSRQLVCGDYNKEFELANGLYVFNFHCKLPKDSPSSYEGEHGRIKYSVKAKINIPWKLNRTTKQSVTVMSLFDLNQLPIAAAPVSEECSKTFWGQSNPLSMTVMLPVRGYVPGQVMKITVNLNNQTDIKIKKISAELLQTVMYYTKERTKYWKHRMSKSEYSLEDSTGFKQGYFNIKVPVLPPSYLQSCSIMDFRYHLIVAAEVNALHGNLQSSTEILIGNVPLMAYESPVVNHQVLPTIASLETENTSCDQSPDCRSFSYDVIPPLSTMYENLSPPTYTQSMQLAASEHEKKESSDSDSDAESEKFASSYPVYKSDTSIA